MNNHLIFERIYREDLVEYILMLQLYFFICSSLQYIVSKRGVLGVLGGNVMSVWSEGLLAFRYRDGINKSELM